MIASGNVGAMLVKIADNMDNLHPDRTEEFARIKPEKAKRLGARYRASITRLAKAAGICMDEIRHVIDNAPPVRP